MNEIDLTTIELKVLLKELVSRFDSCVFSGEIDSTHDIMRFCRIEKGPTCRVLGILNRHHTYLAHCALLADIRVMNEGESNHET